MLLEWLLAFETNVYLTPSYKNDGAKIPLWIMFFTSWPLRIIAFWSIKLERTDVLSFLLK